MPENPSIAAHPKVDPVFSILNKEWWVFKSKPAKKAPPYSGDPLQDHGYVYFDHLKAEYGNIQMDNATEEAKSTIKKINEKRNDSSLKLTWSDIYTFESIHLRLLDDNCLPRKVWDLRNRYREIIGLKEYEAYLASKPPEITGEVKADSLRADIEFLLNKIYLNYSLNPFNEKMRSSISKRVTITVLIGLGLIILTGIFPTFLSFLESFIPFLSENANGVKMHSATILMVLFAGAMGGLMSMLQRYNNLVREGDPINRIIMQSWYQIFVPAINGALFAVLLYMIFIGELIQGDFFPKITNLSGTSSGRSGITALLTENGPENGNEYAKLIIWAFIAGFAERFVPDTLTKIIPKKDTEKEVKSI